MKTESSDLLGVKKEKVFFIITAVLPPLAMLADSGSYHCLFLLTSIAVLIAIFWVAQREELDRFSSASWRDRWRSFMFHLRRVLSGNTGWSWPALTLFLSVSVAFLGWFADGMEIGDPCLALGSLIYAASMILAADMFFKRFLRETHRPPKVLVSWSSMPVIFIYKQDSDCNKQECLSLQEIRALASKGWSQAQVEQALRDNSIPLPNGGRVKRPNFFPILAVLGSSNFDQLQRVELLVARDTVPGVKKVCGVDAEVGNEMAAAYIELIEHMAKALRPGVQFRRYDLDADGHDVVGLRKEMLRIYGRELGERSQDFAFNITGGTSAMSAATILVALRGLAGAVYVRQASDADKIQLTERVEKIDLNIYDVVDIIDEEPV